VPAENKATVLEMPGFVFDVERAELYGANGQRVALRPQVLGVLQCLARNPDFVHSKDELLHAVWPGVVVTEDSLVQCIVDLRRALHDEAHRIVQTEPRRGYRLAATVRPAGAGARCDAVAGTAQPNFHQDIHFARTPEGTRIAYALSGSGPVLVRAAHWVSHLDQDWRSLIGRQRIERFVQRHRLLRYDGRGCGLSDWDADAGTLDDCVADLEAVVDHAGIGRFALYGASSGAAISIRYARRHPERVAGLALIGGYARGALRRGPASTSLDNFHAMARLLEDGWTQDNPAFRQLVTSLCWPAATAEQSQSNNQLLRLSCRPAFAAGLLRRIAEFDATEDLPHVQCPTLVLHSARDAYVPFEEGLLISAGIAQASLHTFDSPNHTPVGNEPAFEEVHRAIDDFVAQAMRQPWTPTLHAVERAPGMDSVPTATRKAS
jgi:pimeloyl-ACP methyl ester carboxylesterase/DNA-binding winged helix-turn-helix (wHTH) protein